MGGSTSTPIPTLFLLLLFSFFMVASDAAPLFSLFNLRDKSKFWSESVIRSDFEDLQSSVPSGPSKTSVLNYTRAGNVANYLKLSEVDSIYLPVPVNFIFIGFEGKGNQGFKLGPEELERWFTKIDHIFEHSRIPPVGEVLTPFFKTVVNRVQDSRLPLVSHIHYNFSVHAMQMGEKVTNVFEHAIQILSRKDDVHDTREDEGVLWQVDVERMEYLFSTLVDYLQLENSYTIFIMNPTHSSKRKLYGYRRGLSEPEIDYLKENMTLQTRILQSESISTTPLAIDKVENSRPLRSHPASPFSWSITDESEMMEWTKKCLDALNNVERLNIGKGFDEIIYDKVVQILHNKDDYMKLLMDKELASGGLTGLHADCLTDAWIGSGRWAFIDLSAGPFSWGPTVGGEGVRTEISLPNVEKTVGAVAEITEDEAEHNLQNAIQERFSSLGDDHQALDILLAEIDIYELLLSNIVKEERPNLLFVMLDQRMSDLEKELEGYKDENVDESRKMKALEALKRMEKWNLFSSAAEEFQSYTVARDSFLAHLGATLWNSMRHIIAPSVSNGEYHYYEKISFQLFFITEEKLRNIKQLPVSVKALTEGLSSLLPPSQNPLFSPHLLSLSEDPALMMAFSVARRAATVPLLLVNATYRTTVRTYLDSSILQHQLKRLSEHISVKGSHANTRSTHEIPIFWFIQSEPLLVDKHYQAKALSDMVIVVQSDQSSWESHLQCNGRPLLWDLRRPIKAAIAATAQHLAGLLPLHLVYSHAHETAIEDWTWSVGCNPFSITSQGWHVSRFQSDTISRSYIITALEESIQSINAAIHRLIMERTTARGFKMFQIHERVLVEKYNSVVALWKRISHISGGLRYGDAVRILSMLEDASRGFSDQVNATLAALHPLQCTRERIVDLEFDITTIPAFILVFAIILWLVLKPRRSKPKIN